MRVSNAAFYAEAIVGAYFLVVCGTGLTTQFKLIVATVQLRGHLIGIKH